MAFHFAAVSSNENGIQENIEERLRRLSLIMPHLVILKFLSIRHLEQSIQIDHQHMYILGTTVHEVNNTLEALKMTDNGVNKRYFYGFGSSAAF